MQDRYVGDIGDFANNGLLRVLCGTPPEPVPDMRLGIIWYRNETEDQYGNEIKYLNPSNYNDQTYRECDPHLYSELQRLVGGSMERNDRRRIEDIIDRGIFPPRTQHYRRLIPRPATVASRRQWFGDAMAKTAESDVIFLNPDIGINWTGQTRLQYVHPWELGCVDISPQPDESGSEMKKAQISGVQLLKPGEYPPVMLYFVDEAFHQMTLPV